MPGISSLRNARSALFAKPEIAALTVGLTTAVGYIVTSFVKLLPLGAHYSDEKSRRNTAQDTFNDDSNKLNGAKEKLREGRQRIVDLDCAKNETTGYPIFNQRVEAFQIQFNESLSRPLDALDNLLKMHFDEDSKRTDTFKKDLSYTEEVTRYGYHYGCPGHWTCGKDNYCCFYFGSYSDTVEHDYVETQTNENFYKNILKGGPLSLEPLQCGYYSRSFTIASPSTVKTFESAPVYSGRKEDGKTFINVKFEWGSKLTATCAWDDKVIKLDTNILREEDKEKAAADLAAKIFRFVATCVSAVQAVGGNYSAVQESIRQSIPGLVEKVVEANATLQEHALVLAKQQADLNVAEKEYDNGLLLWLLQLFLVPGVAAALVYLAIVCLRNFCEPTQNVSETTSKDLEKGVPSKESPRHSPRHFNQNRVSTPESQFEEQRLVYTPNPAFGGSR